VLWLVHAQIARGTIVIENGLWLRRHGDGAGVVLSGDGEISRLVRIVALLLQRSRERLAFLFIGISTGEMPEDAEPKGRKGAHLRLCRAPGSVPLSKIGLVRQ
jgi:hypothetical protein